MTKTICPNCKWQGFGTFDRCPRCHEIIPTSDYAITGGVDLGTRRISLSNHTKWPYILVLSLIVIVGIAAYIVHLPSEVIGEVYIITKGRDNIKLASTAVSFIPLVAAKDYIARAQKNDPSGVQPAWVYFYNAPKPIATAITDSDGKFSTKLPPGEYAAFSASQRTVGNHEESYYWFIRIDATGPVKITLNNANMVSEPASDSLLYLP